ncbi:hypothetical protein H8D30_03485 [bacterium]|nr:hypothetical protein [bacterium]
MTSILPKGITKPNLEAIHKALQGFLKVPRFMRRSALNLLPLKIPEEMKEMILAKGRLEAFGAVLGALTPTERKSGKVRSVRLAEVLQAGGIEEIDINALIEGALRLKEDGDESCD